MAITYTEYAKTGEYSRGNEKDAHKAIKPYRGSYIVDNRSSLPIQKKDSSNSGIDDQTKTVFEQLSGHSFSDVKVHYNSDKPNKIGAHGFAQGTQVYLAPGQNRHLHHELWHVAQQKSGRVTANLSMNHLSINTDKSLEKEADQMGELAKRSIQRKIIYPERQNLSSTRRPIPTETIIQGRFYEQLPDGTFSWWMRPMILAGGARAWRRVFDPATHLQMMHNGFGVWIPNYKDGLDRQRVKGNREADGNTTGLRLGTEDLAGARVPWPGSRNWPNSMSGAQSSDNRRAALAGLGVPQSTGESAWGHQLAMQWGGRARIDNAAAATNSTLVGGNAQEEYQTIVEDALTRFCADNHVPITQFRIKHTAYMYPGTRVAKYMRIKIYRENPVGHIIKVIDQLTPDNAPYKPGGRAQAGTERQVFQMQLEAQLLANVALHSARTTNPAVVMSWDNPGPTPQRP